MAILYIFYDGGSAAYGYKCGMEIPRPEFNKVCDCAYMSRDWLPLQ